jgi:hypothetical protein
MNQRLAGMRAVFVFAVIESLHCAGEVGQTVAARKRRGYFAINTRSERAALQAVDWSIRRR